jgi:hypothetical protein
MVNNQLKIYIKERDLLLGEKIYLKKKSLYQVLPGRRGHRSTEFYLAFSHVGFSLYSDRSSHWVDWVSGRPARLVRV